MDKLFLATKNQDKIIEIKEILNDIDVEIVTVNEIGDIPEVIEDKHTIDGNAAKKALEIAEITGMFCLADDTGFFVNALNGKPGVKAARFAGENCSYKDNRDRMLEQMKGKFDRSAYFETAVVLARPGKIIATVFGKVCGKIADKEYGESGFGYDSIFIANETGLTFGQMNSDQKHLISHRARALEKIKPILNKIINENKE